MTEEYTELLFYKYIWRDELPSELYTSYKGGTILALYSHISMILNIVVSLLIINELGASLYGIRGLLLGSYTLIYSTFYTIIGIPYTRELSDLSAQNNSVDKEFASIIFFLTIFLGTISGWIYYILGSIVYIKNSIYYNTAFLIEILSFSLFLEGIIYYARFTFRSMYAYGKMFLINISYLTTENVGYMILIIIKRVTLETLFMVLLFSRIMGSIISIILLRQFISFNIRFREDLLIKYIKKAGYWAIGSMLYYVFWNIDSYIIPFIVRGVSVGYYYFIKLFISIFITSFMNLRTFLLVFYTRQRKLSKMYVPLITKLNMLFMAYIAFPIIAASKPIIVTLSLFLPTFREFISLHYIISIAITFAIVNEYFTNIATYSDSRGKFERHIPANLLSLASFLVLLGVYSQIKTINSIDVVLYLSISLVIANFVKGFFWHYIAKKNLYGIESGKIILANIMLYIVAIIIKNIVDRFIAMSLIALLVEFFIVLINVKIIVRAIKYFSSSELEIILKSLKHIHSPFVKILALFL